MPRAQEAPAVNQHARRNNEPNAGRPTRPLTKDEIVSIDDISSTILGLTKLLSVCAAGDKEVLEVRETLVERIQEADNERGDGHGR